MAGRIDGVLFDKDGTLFDFQKSWAAWAAGAIAELAEGDPALIRRLDARAGLDRAAERFHADSPLIAGTPADAALALLPEMPGWEVRALARWLGERAAEAPMVPAVPLRPLLNRLAGAGLALGIATNDAEAAARAHLRDAGILDLFGFVAGYDSGHGAKPGPGMCRAFAEAADLAPERVVMVGDSTHDLVAGRGAGMGTVAVLTGVADAGILAPHADAVLPDIGHLPGWLGLAPNAP